jgi:hypothetical protein
MTWGGRSSGIAPAKQRKRLRLDMGIAATVERSRAPFDRWLSAEPALSADRSEWPGDLFLGTVRQASAKQKSPRRGSALAWGRLFRDPKGGRDKESIFSHRTNAKESAAHDRAALHPSHLYVCEDFKMSEPSTMSSRS